MTFLLQAQPHLPSGAVQAGDTTTAARAEAQQASPEAARQVHATAEHTKGVAEHAASTAHVRLTPFPDFWLRKCLTHTPCGWLHQTKGPGVTGNVYDAVTQLRAKVEETTDAAVAEGQKTVQAATNAGANYLGQAKNLASSAISTAAVCLSVSPREFELVFTFIYSRTSRQASREEQLGALPSRHPHREVQGVINHLAKSLQVARIWRADHTQ